MTTVFDMLLENKIGRAFMSIYARKPTAHMLSRQHMICFFKRVVSAEIIKRPQGSAHECTLS